MTNTFRNRIVQTSALIAAAMWIASISSPICWAQADARPDAKEIRGTLLLQAKDYDIQVGKTKLELHDRSLLNWSNASRSTEQGVLMVWLDEGMPMVLASLFTYEYQGVKMKHEFASVTTERLTATYNGKRAWAPKKPGLTWEKWETAGSSPGKAKAIRLGQMRAIARKFHVDLKDAYNENKTSRLRFMPQPVFRFASEKYDTVDGAIFSFCIGTDPEAFLMVRAVEAGHFEYAFVRSIDWDLKAWLGKQQVWHVPHLNNMSVSMLGQRAIIGEPYLSYHLSTDFRFKPHPELELDEEAL